MSRLYPSSTPEPGSEVRSTTTPCCARASLPVSASRVAAVWALCYALYRGYYALGGTVGMFGVPKSETQWRLINAIGAVIILVGAIAPLVMLRWWRRPRIRRGLFALCWIVTVGCVMHAVIDMAERALSLAGVVTMNLPFWASADRRQADLQDLLFNEPWFFIEGLLWAAMAWTAGLNRSPRRRVWVISALVAIAAFTVNGLLTIFGVLGKQIVF